MTLEACCIEEQENDKVHEVNKRMIPIKNAFGLYYIECVYKWVIGLRSVFCFKLDLVVGKVIDNPELSIKVWIC